MLARVEESEPDARSQSVVARRPVAPVGLQELLAVNDGAVRERPHGVRPLARIAHVEHAVEVAGSDPGIGRVLRVGPVQGHGKGGCEREEHDPCGDAPMPVEHARAVAQQRGRDEQGERDHADRQLVEILEHLGRDEADEHAACRPAQGKHQIEAGQMLRMGLGAGQLSVAHHARREERGGVERYQGPDARIGAGAAARPAPSRGRNSHRRYQPEASKQSTKLNR